MKPKKFGKRGALNRNLAAEALRLAQFKPKVVKNKKREEAKARAKLVPDEEQW